MPRTNINYEWTRFWTPEDSSNQEYGFLPDPEAQWNKSNLVTFDTLEPIPCLILLGNPGLGKTKTIQKISIATKERGELSILKNLAEFDSFAEFKSSLEDEPDFQTWKTSADDVILHLFLDSLDEGRLENSKLEHSLERYIRKLPFERLRLRVTCRAAELPTDFISLMRGVWPKKNNVESVQTYYLAQLRQKDVYHAAAQNSENGIDADEFVSSIRTIGIEPLAAHPITLDLLFRISVKYDGHLPNNRREIYELGCIELASEVSEARRTDGYEGEFDENKRLKAAQQIAVLNIVGNLPRISIDNSQATNTLNIQEVYLPDQWIEPKALFVETLHTSLFIPLNSFHMWAHRSYGEFLAAKFLYNSQLTLKQIQSLFINPNDQDQRIAPKLKETAAWLASYKRDVFDWIFQTEPLILIQSNSVQLTSQQKSLLVDQFIKKYTENEFVAERLGWNDFERLSYPELGEKLRPYILDKAQSESVRDFCLDFVYYCQLNSLFDALIKVIFDTTDSHPLRKNALQILTRFDLDTASKSELKILFEDPKKYQLDETMLERVMIVLWPDLISVEELFRRLYLVHQEMGFTGVGLSEIFHIDIVDRLDKDGLLIALKWVEAQATDRDHNISVNSRDFLMQIMRKAWEFIDDNDIRFAFAEAAWSRLLHFNSIISEEYKYSNNENRVNPYWQDLARDSAKRHKLLESMLKALSPENQQNTQILLYLLHSAGYGLPFVAKDDFEWLLDQAINHETHEHRWAYSFLIECILDYTDHDHWALIYKKCFRTRNIELRERFTPTFEMWKINSRRARQAKKALIQRRKNQERWLEHEGKKIPLSEYIHNWLEKCKEDSANWWLLSRCLIANEYGAVFERYWDITKGYGWSLIKDEQEIVLEITIAALRYIQEQNPYIGKVKKNTPIMHRYPALEGYRALVYLESIGLISNITKDQWQIWAEVIVWNEYARENSNAEFDSALLQRAFANANDLLLSKFQTFLQNEESDYLTEVILERFRYSQDEKLEALLLEYLTQLEPQNKKSLTLYRYLLRRRSKASHDAQTLALGQLDQFIITDLNRDFIKQLIVFLIELSQNTNWWDAVWRLLSQDERLLEGVIDSINDWHHSPYLQYLTETQLYELFKVAVKFYRVEEDIEFHSGTVPLRYAQQEWRNTILQVIANRGTQEGTAILIDLQNQNPPIPNVSYLIEQSKSNFRESSWIAPTPTDILHLSSNSRLRLIRNADQLLDLIVETLSQIEKEVRGNAFRQRSVWDKQVADNSFRPVEEEAFSDAIAGWLKQHLKEVVINREVEPRQDTTVPRGQRTDIWIEYVADSNEHILVIIEVKGCWFRDIYGSIQTQLVDQYITNHSNCNHGLYLVGHFSSDKWDKSDDRHSVCSSRPKDRLIQQLEEKAKSVTSTKAVKVKTFVFDATI